MLLGGYARCADCRGQAVNEQRCQRAGILMCDNAGDRPGGCRMFRRKRDTALAKSASVIVLQRALAAEGVLHCVDWDQAIDRRFTGEDAGFNLVIVVRNVAPKIQAAANADHRRESIIRKIFAVLDATWRIRKMPAVT